MNTITLDLKGRIPSKKNSKKIIPTKSGRPIIVSSTEYEKWERYAVKSLALQRILKQINEPIIQCSVTIEMIFPDKIRRDLSNVAEGIMDVLVKTGVLADDDWRVVNKLELIAIGSDPERAGATINIRLPEGV